MRAIIPVQNAAAASSAPYQNPAECWKSLLPATLFSRHCPSTRDSVTSSELQVAEGDSTRQRAVGDQRRAGCVSDPAYTRPWTCIYTYALVQCSIPTACDPDPDPDTDAYSSPFPSKVGPPILFPYFSPPESVCNRAAALDAILPWLKCYWTSAFTCIQSEMHGREQNGLLILSI